MSIIQRGLRQAAVLWPVASRNNFGQPVYSTPLQIRCRWEDSLSEYLSADGQTRTSAARVLVDRDVVEGSKVFLLAPGQVLDSTFDHDVTHHKDAWEVVHFSKNPSFKATEFLRICQLSR